MAMNKSMFTALRRNVQLLISRAVISVVNDSLKSQNLQVTLLDDEVADDVERFQNYGHTGVPPSGSEAIVLSVGGKRQHLVAIAVDAKGTRLNALKSGDSALYHMDGHYLLLTENGTAKLICKQLEVQADSALFDVLETQFTGNVSILGDSVVHGQSVTSGTSTASDHLSGSTSGKNHTHRHGDPQTGKAE